MDVKIAATLLCLTGCALAYGQGIYRGTDEEGNVSFSDQPVADAQEIKLPPLTVLPGTKTLDLELQIDDPLSKPVKYRLIEITSPKHDSTVQINTQNLPISANVMPPIRRDLGHKIQILMDGKVLVENKSSFILDEADRGSHQLSAQVVDESNNVIAESETVTVHVQKPFIRP